MTTLETVKLNMLSNNTNCIFILGTQRMGLLQVWSNSTDAKQFVVHIQQDVLVHVYDASHPQSHAQRANVQKVLEQLGLRPGLMENSIEVLNKTDRV